ncbi:MAG: hypothetical protein HN931_08570 [Desulfobacterales bacterium]|jgi:hypothetical protein|nr:hypothetical protein [Desulfobacteraceae bacterium]MBT4364894.1 hypothetical protein [Desulfobacteraceae bacterium]MBT7086212.1 hypothetical protein [Desulfobacterales bacterium]
METIAVYWEPKPKTYGFNEVTNLSLLNIEITEEKMDQCGLWLIEMADLEISFHLVLAKYLDNKKLRLYILIEKCFEDNVLSHVGKHVDFELEKDFTITSPVELICFQGPHFGDRYGIADTVLNTLDSQDMQVLITVCSGSTVYIVLPEGVLGAARHFLSKAFEVP